MEVYLSASTRVVGLRETDYLCSPITDDTPSLKVEH